VRITEVAFFHKSSRTLLVTDAVVFVPDDAPDVVAPRALLANARDGLLARNIAGGKTREQARGVCVREGLHRAGGPPRGWGSPPHSPQLHGHHGWHAGGARSH
jgi:hypothetical protein